MPPKRKQPEKDKININIKIGEVKAKPKRKRGARKGRVIGMRGDLARIGETRTLYGNLPPPPPQQVILTQQLPPAFQPQQPQISGLLEDVKRERTNLLEDIKREISSQVVKAQGAEQKSELARAGAFDPFNVKEYERPQYNVNERIQASAPQFTEIADYQSAPETPSLKIEDISVPPRRSSRIKRRPQFLVEEPVSTGKPILKTRAKTPKQQMAEVDKLLASADVLLK